jgi:hypothetical protein
MLVILGTAVASAFYFSAMLCFSAVCKSASLFQHSTSLCPFYFLFQNIETLLSSSCNRQFHLFPACLAIPNPPVSDMHVLKVQQALNAVALLSTCST